MQCRPVHHQNALWDKSDVSQVGWVLICVLQLLSNFRSAAGPGWAAHAPARPPARPPPARPPNGPRQVVHATFLA